MAETDGEIQTGGEAMGNVASQEENLGLVGQAWAAWLRGDVDGMFVSFHPEIVWA